MGNFSQRLLPSYLPSAEFVLGISIGYKMWVFRGINMQNPNAVEDTSSSFLTTLHLFSAIQEELSPAAFQNKKYIWINSRSSRRYPKVRYEGPFVSSLTLIPVKCISENITDC